MQPNTTHLTLYIQTKQLQTHLCFSEGDYNFIWSRKILQCHSFKAYSQDGSNLKIACDVIRIQEACTCFDPHNRQPDVAAINQCCHSCEHSCWDLNRHCVHWGYWRGVVELLLYALKRPTNVETDALIERTLIVKLLRATVTSWPTETLMEAIVMSRAFRTLGYNCVAWGGEKGG